MRDQGLDDDGEEDGRRKQLEESRKNALYYGWEYFKYHAQQRQSVFRFYLILVGVVLAGLFASYSEQYKGLADYRWSFGVSFLLLSLMFWRLDVRSYQLVKIAEAYLIFEEERLATDLSTQSIRLAHAADGNPAKFWKILRLATFRQIYAWIFMLTAIVGFFITVQQLRATAFARDFLVQGFGYLCR